VFRVASRRGSSPPGGAGANARRRNAAEEATRSTPLGVVQPAAGSGNGGNGGGGGGVGRRRSALNQPCPFTGAAWNARAGSSAKHRARGGGEEEEEGQRWASNAGRQVRRQVGRPDASGGEQQQSWTRTAGARASAVIEINDRHRCDLSCGSLALIPQTPGRPVDRVVTPGDE